MQNRLDRLKYESDGSCFAYKANALTKSNYCECLDGIHKRCGTYGCPFYKPIDCEDWIRIDRRNMVFMIPPEEVKYVDM